MIQIAVLFMLIFQITCLMKNNFPMVKIRNSLLYDIQQHGLELNDQILSKFFDTVGNFVELFKTRRGKKMIEQTMIFFSND